jgi:primosomal protein N' (replication factor Y)
MPGVEAIDLTREGPPRGRYIAPRLAAAVKIALERGQQVLLFLNRRGYAPLTLCRACGFRFACPNCDAWLVDHRFRRQLVCHHCGYFTPRPTVCPKCQASDSFVACGPGVERLEEEAAALFPDARIMVLSSDLIATAERMREEFKEIEDGHVDIVIGTQLVAKGHHFPKLNLVGIIDADLGLSNGDPRACERTFQLLHQVAGRAGRESGRGYGFLQTHQPNHPVMRALIACDREAFGERDRSARAQPLSPFGRLASIVVSGPDRPSTEGFARLRGGAPRRDGCGSRARGSADRGGARPSPLSILIKAPRAYDLSAHMRDWLRQAPKPATGIKLEVDIDPMSFL